MSLRTHSVFPSLNRFLMQLYNKNNSVFILNLKKKKKKIHRIAIDFTSLRIYNIILIYISTPYYTYKYELYTIKLETFVRLKNPKLHKLYLWKSCFFFLIIISGIINVLKTDV